MSERLETVESQKKKKRSGPIDVQVAHSKYLHLINNDLMNEADAKRTVAAQLSCGLSTIQKAIKKAEDALADEAVWVALKTPEPLA